MHVQGRDFKEALQWLADGVNELPPVSVRSLQPKAKERQLFQRPIPDESKWLAVSQYLVAKRQLPAALVDELHSQGKVYADVKQNVVFLRQDTEGNVTGASLRGTYNDSSFKGLSTGSRRDTGWFSFVQGEGQLQRIVLVESSIDAISAAALAKQHTGTTMFIASGGAGAVPIGLLQQHTAAGIGIIAAHDADRAGEQMAWQLAAEVGAVTRATPTFGKDWNEQLKNDLLPRRVDPQLDVSQWKLVAQAIGKPDAYLGRIEAVVSSGQPLPIEAAAAMRQDFASYKRTSNELWQSYQAARDMGKSDIYLGRIASVAISFHHPKSPTLLSQQAVATMQQDLSQHEQLLSLKLWQHYSRDADPAHPMKTASSVGYAAAKDGYSPDKINQILLHDPALVKIRQRSGEQAAQNYLKIAMRLVDYKMKSQDQSPQTNNQQQSKQQGGLQL